MKKLNTFLGTPPRYIFIAVFSLFCSNVLIGQVTGRVIDAATSEELIGVNVTVKGNDNIGTTTEYDGSFSLDAATTDILVISYIGYTTNEIDLSQRTFVQDLDGTIYVEIKLSESTELLQEVVVVGYGTVGKKDLTGVVTKVDAADFNKGAITSPDRLLNGKVAGLQVANSGEPGGGSRIRLRGGTSISASSDPLVVIDGVPIDNRGNAGSRNPLNFVNANDVESISVLKDASAAAIYGSRGANGVIIITTKSGKSGKPKFSYSGNANMSVFSGSPTILSPNNFRNAIIAKAPQEFEFLGDANTDWVDEVTQNATGTEHNLSVAGGFGKTKYFVSGGFIKTDGVLKTTAHQNTSLSANVSTSLFDDKLTVAVKSKTGISTDDFAPNVIGAALRYDPTRPVLDPDSPFGGYYQWADPLAVNNPVSTLNLSSEQGNAVRSINNLVLEYKLPFIEGLSLKTNLSHDYTTGDKTRMLDPLLKDGDNFVRGGFQFNEDFSAVSKLLETFAIYNRKLESINSNLQFTAGYSWQNTDRENRWEEGNNLQEVDGVLTYTEDIRQDSFLVENRLASFFGRVNLNIDERYLITASLRRDGSSRFGPENKWGLFPAVAVGWRVLQEDWAEGLNNTFTDLKLRASWGVTGNENINDFLFSTFYRFGTDDARYQFGDQFVRTIRGTGVDPGIKWEETTSINLGLDFGFMDNRVSGSIDVYKKFTNDLLFTVATSAFTNLSDRILTNIGEMENEGVELMLNTVVIDGSNWDFDLGFNVAYNRNEITKLDNSNLPEFQGYEAGGISGDVGQTIQILKVGESIETFRTYRHILNADGTPRADNVDFNEDGFISDLDIYEDLNGDGMINESDLLPNKTTAPDFIFGLTSNLRYKSIDLSATFRAHTGNYVYNNVASGSGYFQLLTDRVTNNIDESAFRVNFNERQLKSDYYIEDASFVRLDNITLGWAPGFIDFFDNLRLFATATNIFTMTGYSGNDPELPQFSGGIDNNVYPISRNYLVGLTANF